jgi:enamine deaminase RidA (YjgF/YER057c/UK114 family)
VKPEEKLQAMGLTLPPVAKPVAAYVPVVQSGAHVYVSGQLPTRDGQLTVRGKVGSDLSLDQGYQAARLCALNALAAVKAQLGDLGRVVRVVKVTGFVAGAPGFVDQPKVVNGASELLVELFGERGRHARTSVGVAELPLGAPVEIELLVEAAER